MALFTLFKIAKFAKKAVKIAKVARQLKAMKKRAKRGDYVGAAESLDAAATTAKGLKFSAPRNKTPKNRTVNKNTMALSKGASNRSGPPD